MKKFLFTAVFIMISISLFAAYTYTAQIPHPYTGEYYDYTITANDDGTYTITFFENTRTFTYTDFTNGTYEQWLLDIIEEMYPVSSSGSGIQSFTALNSTLNNISLNSSSVRIRMNDQNQDRNVSPGEVKDAEIILKIVPDVSYLYFLSGESVIHVAAGICGEKSVIRFNVKPWFNYAPGYSRGYDLGVNCGYTGISYIGDDIDLSFGMGLALASYDSIISEAGFLVGVNGLISVGYYLSDSTMLSAGIGYNLDITGLALSHGYAAGMNALTGLTQNLFLSVNTTVSSSLGGISFEGGAVVPGGSMLLDFGGSVGYYISDSFFIELGGQYIMNFEGEDTIGASFGSSYRF